MKLKKLRTRERLERISRRQTKKLDKYYKEKYSEDLKDITDMHLLEVDRVRGEERDIARVKIEDTRRLLQEARDERDEIKKMYGIFREMKAKLEQAAHMLSGAAMNWMDGSIKIAERNKNECASVNGDFQAVVDKIENVVRQAQAVEKKLHRKELE